MTATLLKERNQNQTVNEQELEGKNESTTIYNADFKEKFYKRYKEVTIKSTKSLFRGISSLERKYKKDIYDFRFEEFEEVLYSLEATTVRSLQDKISTLEQYIDFAIKKKVVAYKINLASAFDSKHKIEKYLSNAQTIFLKNEIMRIATEALNAQDGVILALIFDGVSFKNEFEELINLHKKDINFEENTIKLTNRTIYMSLETATLVRRALNDREYYNIKGEQPRKYKIADSDYVLRGLRNNFQIKWRNINQRILRLSELNDLKHLNAINTSYSGQVHLAKQLLDKGLSLDNVILEVMERFDINDNESSRYYVRTRIEEFLESQQKNTSE